ncbi:hypothetical protein V1477_017133 [Vespula maculifrons]|uniref:Uncharacterized protein n=1 Tax=Vespula maculifrons TaxID=7453 RepID=A0ABD2B547_VESMC
MLIVQGPTKHLVCCMFQFRSSFKLLINVSTFSSLFWSRMLIVQGPTKHLGYYYNYIRNNEETMKKQ